MNRNSENHTRPPSRSPVPEALRGEMPSRAETAHGMGYFISEDDYNRLRDLATVAEALAYNAGMVGELAGVASGVLKGVVDRCQFGTDWQDGEAEE